MGSNTILILYVTVGQGHRQAAFAIRDALNAENPFCRIVCLDLMELWKPWLGRFIVGGYRALIHFVPRFWAYLYDHQRIKEKISRPLDLLHRLARNRVCLLIQELSPSAVVCTQAFPCALAATCKALSRVPFSLVAVPTDYRVHAYWIYDQVNLYLLPSLESKTLMISRGVPSGLNRVSGIPVHPIFDRALDAGKLKLKYGLDPKLPAILLMGGGEGTISLKRLILTLDRREEEFQIAALTGRNLKQHADLKELRRRIRHSLAVFSFTDYVDELMATVDIIITKPGGLTTAEALVKKVPMVLIAPLPGQEEFNARFLREHGAALQAADEFQASRSAAELLRNDGLRQEMKTAMEEIRKPAAALQAARYILATVSEFQNIV